MSWRARNFRYSASSSREQAPQTALPSRKSLARAEGAYRNRTGVNGFAGWCICAFPAFQSGFFFSWASPWASLHRNRPAKSTGSDPTGRSRIEYLKWLLCGAEPAAPRLGRAPTRGVDHRAAKAGGRPDSQPCRRQASSRSLRRLLPAGPILRAGRRPRPARNGECRRSQGSKADAPYRQMSDRRRAGIGFAIRFGGSPGHGAKSTDA